MMNFSFLRPVATCVMLVGLSACGGGGGGSDPVVDDDVVIPTPTDPTTPDTSASGPQASTTALLTTWASSNSPVYTGLSTIPTNGGADYAGYVYGDLSNGSDAVTDSVIGSLTLAVDFNSNGATLSGTAKDFVDEDDNDLTGKLTISGGSLDRDGNPANDATIRGVNVAGTLTDDANHALAFGFQLEGDFLGSAYNAVGGEALGSVTVGGVEQDFDGGFIAER